MSLMINKGQLRRQGGIEVRVLGSEVSLLISVPAL